MGITQEANEQAMLDCREAENAFKAGDTKRGIAELEAAAVLAGDEAEFQEQIIALAVTYGQEGLASRLLATYRVKVGTDPRWDASPGWLARTRARRDERSRESLGRLERRWTSYLTPPWMKPGRGTLLEPKWVLTHPAGIEYGLADGDHRLPWSDVTRVELVRHEQFQGQSANYVGEVRTLRLHTATGGIELNVSPDRWRSWDEPERLEQEIRRYRTVEELPLVKVDRKAKVKSDRRSALIGSAVFVPIFVGMILSGDRRGWVGLIVVGLGAACIVVGTLVEQASHE